MSSVVAGRSFADAKPCPTFAEARILAVSALAYERRIAIFEQSAGSLCLHFRKDLSSFHKSQRLNEVVTVKMSQIDAAHTESIDGQDPANETQKKVKSRRPASKSGCPACGDLGAFLLKVKRMS